MQEIIREKLCEIEARENVKILYAAESGSRAWGFASPDSDYDVRFIYLRAPEYYLRLDRTRDVIEWQLDETLDINGWDVQKALRLLHASNPTLFEWASSPIVYRTSEAWEKIRSKMDGYFLCSAGVYHYLHTAEGNYREYLKGEEVRLKKYFYVLRPILACRWIFDFGTPPPMRFEELAEAELDGSLRPAVEDLLRRKSASPEFGTGKRIDALNGYIEAQIAELGGRAERLASAPKNGIEQLNGLFLELLGMNVSR